MASRDFIRGIVVGSSCAALVVTAASFVQRLAAARALATASAGESTTSSAQSVGVYETEKAVDEYLLFHFGSAADIIPYQSSISPLGALDFAERTAGVCIAACKSAGVPLRAAFDVGCAVGGTAFALSRDFDRVVALDYSHAFVAAAQALFENGSTRYSCTVEGEMTASREARLPAGVRGERLSFMQGDACALPDVKALGGKFSVVHAANLICRLPDPM